MPRRDAQNADEAARKSWELIAAEGPALIAKTAKDLEVASWLSEALLRRHQLAGLRDGLKLLGGLVERYWDGVYPLPDEDGLETPPDPGRRLDRRGGGGRSTPRCGE